MNQLNDLPLLAPIAHGWDRALLFAVFTTHLLFVLMMLGTAALGVFYFFHMWWSGRLGELRWDKSILQTFIAHKSLAVVLGVGALLMIQVGWTPAFFNAINLFGPYWIAIVALLIGAFISFDSLAHREETHHYVHTVFALFASILLFTVPGIFVLILVTTENSAEWLTIAKNSNAIGGHLSVHWIFRYIHVLGAAIVFASIFHYFFTSKGDPARERHLLYWAVFGLLIQFIDGPLLFISIPRHADITTAACVCAGMIFAAGLLAWIVAVLATRKKLHFYWIVVLMMSLLVAMLLARQQIQDRSVMPLIEIARKNRDEYKKVMNNYEKEAREKYNREIRLVYDNGPTIYNRSCAFCHGLDGTGNGPETKNLAIPPEDISAIRSTYDYLHEKIAYGIEGSAMPYFAIFDRVKLDRLITYLNMRFNVLSRPVSMEEITESDFAQAKIRWDETCSMCHGIDGKGTALSKGFKPSPPDFQSFSLTPERTFEVITNGYPGTMMGSFEATIPENIRWALVKVEHSKRTQFKSPVLWRD
jgi:mono/diheme cytochrome c family protein